MKGEWGVAPRFSTAPPQNLPKDCHLVVMLTSGYLPLSSGHLLTSHASPPPSAASSWHRTSGCVPGDHPGSKASQVGCSVALALTHCLPLALGFEGAEGAAAALASNREGLHSPFHCSRVDGCARTHAHTAGSKATRGSATAAASALPGSSAVVQCRAHQCLRTAMWLVRLLSAAHTVLERCSSAEEARRRKERGEDRGTTEKGEERDEERGEERGTTERGEEKGAKERGEERVPSEERPSSLSSSGGSSNRDGGNSGYRCCGGCRGECTGGGAVTAFIVGIHLANAALRCE